jgi:hypothetical protein
MTPFMKKVDDVLRGQALSSTPDSSRSALRPLGEALHNQVELRALAEQLVSEANVVLNDHGTHLDLVDEPGGENLSFTVSCGHARAVVVTALSGRQAWGRLIWGDDEREMRELTGTEALADLILGLVASGRPAPTEV